MAASRFVSARSHAIPFALAAAAVALAISLLSAAGPAESALAGKAAIAEKRAVLGPDGAARVTLKCKGSDRCRGSLRIHSRKTSKQAYGKARFKIKSSKADVAVRLKKKVAARVHRTGRLRATGVVATKGGKGKVRRSRRRLAIVPAAGGPTVPVLHRIKATNERLYNTVTGQTFVPRGANYVRLTQAPNGEIYHSAFEPGVFDPATVAAALDQMRHDGYNVVRVFIDPGGSAAAGPHGLGRGSGRTRQSTGPTWTTSRYSRGSLPSVACTCSPRSMGFR